MKHFFTFVSLGISLSVAIAQPALRKPGPQPLSKFATAIQAEVASRAQQVGLPAAAERTTAPAYARNHVNLFRPQFSREYNWNKASRQYRSDSIYAGIRYNDAGQITRRATYSYSTTNGRTPDSSSRQLTYYDALGRDTSTVFQLWTAASGTWRNFFKTLDRYNVQGDFVFTAIYDASRTTPGLWILSSGVRYTNTYDAQNRLVEEIREGTDIQANWQIEERNLFIFPATTGGFSRQITMLPDSATGTAWDSTDKYEVTWHDYIQRQFGSYKVYTYAGGWQPVAIASLAYSGVGGDYALYYGDYDGVITDTSVRVTNTSNPIRQETLVELYEGNGLYLNENRSFSTFDASHNQTENASQVWTGTTWEYTGTRQQQHTYDAQNRVIQTLRSDFVPDSGRILLTSRSRYDRFIEIVAIDEPVVKATLTFYPQPATNQVFVQGIEPKASARIYSTEGRLVRTQATIYNAINVQGLTPGIYQIQLTSKTGLQTARLLVQ